MKPTINEFENFVERCASDCVEWHGEYNGRFYYKGIAVVAEYDEQVVEMLNSFNKPQWLGEQLVLGGWDHEDNMGRDHYIYAWSLDKFREEEKEEA